jgi:quinol monooxygenase YgiN
MFVQVIKGRTRDGTALRAHAERWTSELRPGAIGYLDGTCGTADEGTFFVLARFQDEAAARANSQRPEQGTWWADLEALLDGEATFRESTDVRLLFDGPSEAAGFVQVMEGTAPDRAKAEAVETPEFQAQLRSLRPDLLGGLRAWFDGGAYVEVAYFTAEDEARQGESSGGFETAQADFAAAFGEPTYLDLRDVLHS